MNHNNTYSFYMALILTLFLGTVGCTQKKAPLITEVQEIETPIIQPPPAALNYVHDIQFNGQSTQVFQMKVRQGSLFVSGRPFLLSRWNISANPTVPTLTFAAADNINTFSQNSLYGPPVFDWIAMNALGWFGSHLVTSGTAGASVVDITNTHSPVEVFRNPSHASGNHSVNPEFVYRAIVNHPTRPIGYGFREQDYVMTFNTSFPSIQKVEKVNYAQSGNICCVKAAEFFGGKIYVAATSALMIYGMDENGRLNSLQTWNAVEPVNMAVTSNFLYIQHEPIATSGNTLPRGIYVFDRSGTPVHFLNITPIAFAVSGDDSFLYANESDDAISIYSVNWEAAPNN